MGRRPLKTIKFPNNFFCHKSKESECPLASSLLSHSRYPLLYFGFLLFSMDRHEEDLKSTLGARGTSESLHSRLQEHVRVKQRELKEMRNNLQRQKQLLSSKQMRKKMIT